MKLLIVFFEKNPAHLFTFGIIFIGMYMYSIHLFIYLILTLMAFFKYKRYNIFDCIILIFISTFILWGLILTGITGSLLTVVVTV